MCIRLLIGLFLWMLLTANSTVERYPIMTFENTEYDYGNVKAGALVTSEFKFTNTGNAPLIIQSYKTSCGCQIPLEWPREVIPIGGKGVIRSQFNTTGRSGKQIKNSTVHANTKEGYVRLLMTGTVTP